MNKYTPHPWHQLLPFLMLLIASMLFGMYPGFVMGVMFIATVVISVATSLWIAWAGKIREETDYWMWIGDSITKLKNAEPDIWEALGFVRPPHFVTLKLDKTETPERAGYYSTSVIQLPASGAELKLLADGLLSGTKGLAEAEWCGKNKPFSTDRFRALKHEMLRLNLIIQTNPKDVRQGFTLTELGEKYLMEYASGWVLEDMRTRTISAKGETPTQPSHPPTSSTN